MRFIISSYFMLLSMSLVQAQVDITGTISDDKGELLFGATIILKGTNVATISDIDGSYSISLPQYKGTLVYSYVGYKTQEVVITDQSLINITLAADIAQLDEVVMIGYGSQRKGDITGSIAIVDTDELTKSSYTTITDRLQGRIAGVSVSTNGEPGSTGTIKIRGNSFFGNNNPLYVIDGILTNDSPNLNPNDIESIQVLKDASSTAIYGSRAANGVIVITTKKGKSGKPEIQLSFNGGLQQVPQKIDVTNSALFARINNAAYTNDPNGIPQTRATDLSHGVDTDWQDAIFQNAMLYDLNLGISGGSDQLTAFFSLNSTYQEGTIIGPVFERLSGRINTEYKVTDWLSIGENLAVSHSKSTGQQELDGEGVINNAVNMLPTVPVFDPTRPSGYGYGLQGEATTFYLNPVGIRDLYTSEENTTRIIGNVFAKLQPIKGLEYQVSFSVDVSNPRFRSFTPGGFVVDSDPILSGLEETRSTLSTNLIENRLSYSREIDKHSFSVMATYTEQQIKFNYQGTSIVGGFDGDNPIFQISASTADPNNITSTGFETTSVIQSYLGRATYNYDNRYLITGNLRYDGSSKFNKENRWGLFPSISGGWNVSNESFFDVEAISNLKVRLGYGEVGNASVEDYAYQARILSRSIGGVNYNLGIEDNQVLGATRDAVVNPNLKWEVLKETNLGFDLALFDGRFELIGDIFFGKLEDLLVDAPLPGTLGAASSFFLTENETGTATRNIANMKRNGWEFAMTYKNFDNDFKYEITANVFRNNNEVTSLPEGSLTGLYSITQVGQALGQLFLPQYQGIYLDTNALNDMLVEGRTPVIGDARYIDLDGSGNFSFGEDNALIGNPNPGFEYGLNVNLSWKDWDMTVFFQGVQDRDIFNQFRFSLNSSAISNYTSDFNPYIDGVGTDPRPISNNQHPNNFPSTRFIEDGSFLRLKNFQLGYTIPFKGVKQARVFIGGQNLFTITDYTGLDPEFEGEVLSPGVDFGSYPNVRTYNMGINVTL